MDELRVGIVGPKFAATLHAECHRCNDKVEIVAVAALDDLEGSHRSAAEGRTIEVRR